MDMNRSQYLRLLTPSFVSGLTTLLVSVGLVVTVLTPYLYQGSYLERYGEVAQAQFKGSWTGTYQQIAGHLNSSELIGTISIFFVWGIIGVAVYYFAVAVLSWFINVSTFAGIFESKYADKRSIIVTVAERLAIRIAGLVALGCFLAIVFQVLLPGILTLVAAVYASSILLAAFYLIASIIFLSAILHIIVVLLRVIFLRPRLTSWLYQPADAE